ncbi:hypothetical protein PAXRUDRAFT_747916 [Paxillus rubicundulus Ve08.2h10]|uniref:Uncharacterized protein n=1 Tax=Paxillus rubicundulus Ve08.2h10 TaxID=930991 RepID=A0A0D0DQK1_9AGAM|nr:hypothetical protein PAXRUDRAFT_747916 [Paxillus rubicundulus Ve08.2h10]
MYPGYTGGEITKFGIFDFRGSPGFWYSGGTLRSAHSPLLAIALHPLYLIINTCRPHNPTNLHWLCRRGREPRSAHSRQGRAAALGTGQVNLRVSAPHTHTAGLVAGGRALCSHANMNVNAQCVPIPVCTRGWGEGGEVTPRGQTGRDSANQCRRCEPV